MGRRDPGAMRPHVGQGEGHGEAEDAGAHLLQHHRAEDEVERRRILQRLAIVVCIQVDVPEAEHQWQRLQCAEQRAPELPELRRTDPEVVVGVADQARQPDQRHPPEHRVAHALDVGVEHQHQQEADQGDVDHLPHAFDPVVHHVPAEVLAHVLAFYEEHPERPHQGERDHADRQRPMDLVPLLARREGLERDEGQDREADQDDHVGATPGLKVLQPLLDPGLAHPPARLALRCERLRKNVPQGDRDQCVEQELDQPRRIQFALREQRSHIEDRADEPGQDPDDAQVQVFGTGDVEVELACQQRRIIVL